MCICGSEGSYWHDDSDSFAYSIVNDNGSLRLRHRQEFNHVRRGGFSEMDGFHRDFVS